MNCPMCGAKTKVLDTRGIIRRRVCLEYAEHAFETKETVSFHGSRPQGRPPGTRKQQFRWAGLS